MRYIINNNVFKTPYDVKIYILSLSGEAYFKEMLNEKYRQIEICGKNYLASDILRKFSPLTYQCEKINLLMIMILELVMILKMLLKI